MRRRAGVGKLLQKKREREQAAAKGQEIETQHLEHVETVLAEFKEHLESFASRHRDDINRVCAAAARRAEHDFGADPGASGAWVWLVSVRRTQSFGDSSSG